jgi:hypothetical protein
MRNTDLTGAGQPQAVWNGVFTGSVEAAPQNFGPGASAANTTTNLATTPASSEKPYLFIDDAGMWNVFVPALQTDSVGASWANGHTPGQAIPLSQFFIASPSDDVKTINQALARGLNLLLTPGVYDYSAPIEVKKADTVVLGLGHATLTAMAGNAVLTTADVQGIQIAGVTADAGPINSPVLIQIGTEKGNNGKATTSASNPTVLSDVFVRIGGPHVGKADVSLQINSDNVILDHAWLWRADHGVSGSVGWDINTGDTGLVVNGNNVLATGLFVEHYQKYNVIWNGEGGEVLFFQNELPYDAPNQAAWQHTDDQGNLVLGWAAFKVADTVKTFTGWGFGSYIYFNQDPTLHVTQSYEVPVTPGVQMHDLVTVQLNANNGMIESIINGVGEPTTASGVAYRIVNYGG